MRLIDLDALIQFPIRIDHYDKENGNENFIFGIETVIEFAENLPVIEAEPVKHGRWEHIRMLTTGDGRVKVGDCSSCKSIEKVRNYCPKCGCKMDLEAEG